MARYFAIGDIHGCFHALKTVIKAIKLKPDDVVITLGGYVDRGTDSCAVLDWLVHFSSQGNLIALRGNHEQMMLKARSSQKDFDYWLDCGGKATLKSYSPFSDSGKLVDVPDSHWKFLEEYCQDWFEIDTHFFVHANAYLDMEIFEQPEYMLFWEQFHNPPPHQSGKIMVCGHTAQKNGIPSYSGHAVCIDTWVYGKGWLTCLNVKTGEYWQSNESGEIRRDYLAVNVDSFL